MKHASPIKRLIQGIAFAVAVAVLSPSSFAQSNAEAAPNAGATFTKQDWHLNPEKSFLTFQSIKKNAVLEIHRFGTIAGKITRDGKAAIKIDLASVETGVDIRNVRMRFLLFEAFKFPLAEITADIAAEEMQRLDRDKRFVHELKFELNLHGMTKEYKTKVIVARIYDNAVSVATTEPIVVKAADFGMAEGVLKLAAAVGDIPIAPAAFVSFNVLFESERFNPNVKSVVASAATKAAEAKTTAYSDEDCRSRFTVLSETQAIYFRAASARIRRRSTEFLASIADVVKRCTTLKIEAAGHTDSDGSSAANMKLSKARAQAVVDYLVSRGISADQLKAVGYGDTKPIAPNTTRSNKAKNRRIEFRVIETG